MYKWLERNGFEVALTTSMDAAQEKLTKQSFHVVLSDLRLPDGDGIMLLNWLNEKGKNEPVIIMTGYGDVQTAVSAIKLGAFDYLEKPVNPSILKKKIEAACTTDNRKKESVVVQKDFKADHFDKKGEIVFGQSVIMQEMYRHVDLVAHICL